MLSHNTYALLTLYRSILEQHEEIVMEERYKWELIIIGLVIQKEDKLEVTNKIYAEVFNQQWVEQTLQNLKF